MSYETILTERHDAVGLIRLNRPRALNALNPLLLTELADAALEMDHDPTIGAIVITGNNRAFAAGADISRMADADSATMVKESFIDLWDRISAIRIPTIAAISGYCLGGGNELAMACDMIVASDTAIFGQPEIGIGVIPGAGGTQRLTRAIGKALAMEMVLNDRRLSADEALHHGLVNYVYPLDMYLDKAVELAGQIGARAPIAIQLGKEAVNQAFESSLYSGLQFERRLFYLLFGTEDQKEGMAAFLEKRKPHWQGK